MSGSILIQNNRPWGAKSQAPHPPTSPVPLRHGSIPPLSSPSEPHAHEHQVARSFGHTPEQPHQRHMSAVGVWGGDQLRNLLPIRLKMAKTLCPVGYNSGGKGNEKIMRPITCHNLRRCLFIQLSLAWGIDCLLHAALGMKPAQLYLMLNIAEWSF